MSPSLVGGWEKGGGIFWGVIWRWITHWVSLVAECACKHAMQWVPTHVCRPLRDTLGREEGTSVGSLSYTCPGVMRPLLAGPGNRGCLELKGGPYLAASPPFRRLPGGTALSPWGSQGWSEPWGWWWSVTSHQDWHFTQGTLGALSFLVKK